jgi:Mg2+-importing ATPase
MESVISASMIVLVIRTRKPLFKSKPRKHLLIATLSIVGTTALYFLVVGCNCFALYHRSRNSKGDILQKSKT